MKIIYFYPERKNDFMFQWQRLHFIDELSRYGIEISIMNPLEYDSLEQAYNALLRETRSKHYDLLLMCSSLFVTRELLDDVRRLGTPSLFFRPDNLLIPYFDKDIASAFDLVWLTSKETEHLYKKWNVNYFFAPYAANPNNFYPASNELIRRVCFIGTPYGSRTNMINTIISSGALIDVYCKNNPALNNTNSESDVKYNPPTRSSIESFCNFLGFHEGRKVLLANLYNRIKKHKLNENAPNLSLFPKVTFEEMNCIYSSYSLAFSSTSARNTDVLSHPVNVINLRAFEIPMAGGLQFCRYSEEMSEYFEEDKEILFYRSNDELADKARYYTQKANDTEIKKMKEAARNRAVKEHTWMNRFKQAFELLNLKY